MLSINEKPLKNQHKFSINPKKLILLFICPFLFSGCAFQTRWGSRITGQPINIDLPKDCVKVINVSFEPESKSVTCYDKDANVFSQEYSDWGVFQGRVNWGKEKVVETPINSEQTQNE